MILTLDKVCKSVGASVHIDNVSMVLESGSLKCAARGNAGGQNLIDAADGGAG